MNLSLQYHYKKIAPTAKCTFFEIYKSRIMITVLFLGLALMLISYLASELSYGVPSRIAFDFGFGVLSLSSVGISIFIGVTLLSKEIENRTIYMALSRPASRIHFILGKFFGLTGIVFINILILGVLTLLAYFLLGGVWQDLFSWILLFTFFESLMALVLVIFFSLLTNVIMSVVYTLLVYIGGHAINEAIRFTSIQKNNLLNQMLSVLSWIFPNFSKINIKDFALYKQMLPFDYLLATALYAFCYIFLILVLSILIFEKKSLD